MRALPRASAADKVCSQTAKFLFLGGKGHLLAWVPATVQCEVTPFVKML